MAKTKPFKKYLLLDKDDITNVCGSLYADELAKLLKIYTKNKSVRILLWLTHHGILEDKYVVIEDI